RLERQTKRLQERIPEAGVSETCAAGNVHVSSGVDIVDQGVRIDRRWRERLRDRNEEHPIVLEKCVEREVAANAVRPGVPRTAHDGRKALSAEREGTTVAEKLTRLATGKPVRQVQDELGRAIGPRESIVAQRLIVVIHEDLAGPASDRLRNEHVRRY